MSRIIVKNLPSNITEQKLRSLFEEKGLVTDVQLKYKNGVFRKFAFVGYKTEEEAKAARDYFHSTFIHTSKIQVEMCKNLCDPKKPKPWKEIIETAKAKKDEKSKPSRPKYSVIPDELKDDPKFKEFLAVHEDRRSKPLWADDITAKDETVPDFSDDGYNTAVKEDTDGESNKVKKSTEETSVKETEKANEKDKKKRVFNGEFTVKLKNLPPRCSKKDIKDLFRSLKITSLRLPRKIKGFGYVSFKTENDMKRALYKNKGVLDGRQISITKYTKQEEDMNSSQQNKQPEEDMEKNLEMLAETGQIYARNLVYDVTETELEELFSKYGKIAEIKVPISKLTKKNLGYAFITYVFAEHAVKAYTELDQTIFQGRTLHLIPATPKKEDVDKNENNFKTKKEAKIKALAGSAHNWNILFLGKNAVADIISEKYNVDKADLLSGESKESVAVRMALAETQLVLEARKFLIDNGVQLDAFSQAAAERSKTVIVVKDLPAKTTAEEIKTLFSKHGVVSRVIVPPSGLIALVEFQESAEAKNAFKNLAYTCFHQLPLYLEWAPVDSLKEPPVNVQETNSNKPNKKVLDDELNNEESVDDEANDEDEEPLPGTTVFVKNINFCTTDERFRKHFEKCGPIQWAKISTKKDMKTGKMLSMGFGFVQFKKPSSAAKAIQTLQLSKLDGHALEIKLSARATAPQAIGRKKSVATKQLTSKILVKNIHFKATEQEIKDLFKEFGTLKSVRLPRKLGGTDHRGFGFVEYLTKSDAKRAFEALCHSTHLFDRRLVLEWANPESQDVEELRKKTARDFANSGLQRTKLKKTKLMEDVAMARLKDGDA